MLKIMRGLKKLHSFSQVDPQNTFAKYVLNTLLFKSFQEGFYSKIPF